YPVLSRIALPLPDLCVAMKQVPGRRNSLHYLITRTRDSFLFKEASYLQRKQQVARTALFAIGKLFHTWTGIAKNDTQLSRPMGMSWFQAELLQNGNARTFLTM